MAAAALLGPAAALAAARAAGTPGVPAALGAQLYTVRDLFPGDVVGVLEALHRAGYRELEFAGLAGRTPAAMRALVDEIGFTAPSAHLPLAAIRADLGAQIAVCQTMGHRWLVVPWLAPELRPTNVDGYLRLADEINGYAARTDREGVRMAYHNHDFEFDTFGGDRPAYDALAERLDPALVDLQLDLYWAIKAGYDPVAYFERYPGRFPLWHVRDGRGAGNARVMADVGAGDTDWARIFAASETAGLRHAAVEHDTTPDPLATLRASHDFLAALRRA